MSTVRFYIALIALVLASCSNEVVYDVGTLEPSNEGNKTELKDDLQFMSIAYRDLFGEEVPPDVLSTMRKAYISFGDKELIIDEIVQTMLVSPDLDLPSDAAIAADRSAFISDTYRKFLLRDPSDFELAFWESQLMEQTDLTAKDVYYVFMTCQEYKYYSYGPQILYKEERTWCSVHCSTYYSAIGTLVCCHGVKKSKPCRILSVFRWCSKP